MEMLPGKGRKFEGNSLLRIENHNYAPSGQVAQHCPLPRTIQKIELSLQMIQLPGVLT